MSMINLGALLSGRPFRGMSKWMLSPFTHSLSAVEADTNELIYKNLSLEKRREIADDFKRYFEGMGQEFIFVESHPNNILDKDEKFFEINICFNKLSQSLVDLVDDFLLERGQKTVFHLDKKCFFVFGYDMSLVIIARELPNFDCSFERIFLTELR